jgi:formate dehydrogenase iron-sulfur subunit
MESVNTSQAYGVLVDLTRCAGGRACVAACKKHNGLPMEAIDHVTISSQRTDCFIGTEESSHRPALSAKTYTVVEYHNTEEQSNTANWVFVKRQCMHCEHPACESACPVGAFRKTEEGAVVYDGYKCMGCRYCMMACPFNIPTYEWDKPVPYVRKCTFCIDRISKEQGEAPREERQPACVAICPTKCLQFGKRDELLAEAKRRLEANPDRYVQHIYGEHEAGGTSWLYISAVPFEELGFPTNVGTRPYPEYTEMALDSVPPMIVGGGTVLAGLYLLWKRKAEVAEKENGGGSKEGGKS